MDSSIPPPPSLGLRKLRPWYVVPAMVLTWCVGIYELMAGCSAVAYLRGGTLPDMATATRNARESGELPEVFALLTAVTNEAMHRFDRTMLPLGIAQAMLGVVLVLASGLMMGSRPSARTLALQALAANALFTAISYVLTRHIRTAVFDAVDNVVPTISPDLSHRAVIRTREMLEWRGRILIGGELGTLALGALALTRARAKIYFDALMRAAESAEEP